MFLGGGFGALTLGLEHTPSTKVIRSRLSLQSTEPNGLQELRVQNDLCLILKSQTVNLDQRHPIIHPLQRKTLNPELSHLNPSLQAARPKSAAPHLSLLSCVPRGHLGNKTSGGFAKGLYIGDIFGIMEKKMETIP